MQSTNPLPALIRTALSQGISRAQLMTLAECSRMQLWRMENGLTAHETGVSRKLVRALHGAESETVDETLAILSERLKNADATRRDSCLLLLRSVTKLLG